MRIQQLSELLKLIASGRLEMKTLYRRLSQHVDSTRVKMVLDYLGKNQQQAHDALARYLAEAPTRILGTWYDGVVFEDFSKRCKAINLAPNANDEDVLELHLDLENRLLALLQQGADLAPTQEIRSALSELVAVEKNQQRRLVHNVQRMEDI
ncbi:hypothetical protein [Shewanella sp. SR44-3]|uniref:hypothetical protein n=1 Tax=unclassified Shewanella TaxID=196818 RepID=UPI0015FDCF7E|nr:hypothetical protein [Shewanella sp. SR44-3]MBB1268299.1 hypothetical protein [Shewanella sp. SR44-3]